ncbi:hypothetical protein [Sabulibacter ruber]|uniref:hypothetical protein n=1 Tax=Sabulibacter ruber TaxID=2811901 RepID=UPI001A9665E0|nr:hypothetical protein [Sabulibacter ruber]
MENSQIRKLEQEIALKQKCLYSAELQKMNKKVAQLLLQELKELKDQLKQVKQQQLKAEKKKSFASAY